jgi:hypothetical protein
MEGGKVYLMHSTTENTWALIAFRWWLKTRIGKPNRLEGAFPQSTEYLASKERILLRKKGAIVPSPSSRTLVKMFCLGVCLSSFCVDIIKYMRLGT